MESKELLCLQMSGWNIIHLAISCFRIQKYKKDNQFGMKLFRAHRSNIVHNSTLKK